MADIKVLSEDTIDKIAAGEVVERPMSVVKELVENAMDAGAGSVTVEIKNGGIDLIRITDNGQGIPAEQVRIAFARHATSKIRSVDDLSSISSMGFRGEALSSIAAVSQVELITKTREALAGIRYVIEGAAEKEFEEVGAPDGTTFLVKNLFYNTPVRRKFLKQPQTEAGYVAELLEKLALARPDISFKFVQNGQVKFHTPGNGDLKEVIYRIYGREISSHLVPVDVQCERIRMKGFLGKPEINRSNRNFEHYFINSRYVKSKVLAKAIEDGYKEYIMQHKFPFVVLHFEIEGGDVDVNVHPTKMEVRFSDEQYVHQKVVQAIITSMRSKELIVDTSFGKETRVPKAENMPAYDRKSVPEPFMPKAEVKAAKEVQPFVLDFDAPEESTGVPSTKPLEKLVQSTENFQKPEPVQPFTVQEPELSKLYNQEQVPYPPNSLSHIQITDVKQETLFEEQFLSEKAKETYDILGQIFGTYWIIAYSDRMYMIDQHAAHEKVKYERLVAAIQAKEVLTQSLLPPVILQTSASEERVVLEHLDVFTQIGFELEAFGDHTFCLRAVPVELYGCSYQELFREILDELSVGPLRGTPEVITNKLASMACKAAVKGNTRLDEAEAKKLIDELLTLENPYHCPHGRPTIISMTKQEVEKKFKRIV